LTSRPKIYLLGLVLLLLVVGATSTYVVLADNRPLIHDPLSNVMPAALLRDAVLSGSSAAWRLWLDSTWYRPPLPSVLSLPAVLMMEDTVAAVRLTEVGVFLLLLLLLYDLGARLASRRAGLLAALLCAALPLMQGWCRAGNADPVIWIALLLLFRVLLVVDLRSPWKAAALGLSVGLCLATRLLALAFLVGPALWLLAVRVRTWRAAVGLWASGVWAVAVIGWWYVAQFDAVYDNYFMSTADAYLQERTLARYLETGSGWVVAGALLAWVLAWRRRILDRDRLILFGAWVMIPWLQFLFVWHIWERYPLAVVPQCALLVAVVLDHITRDSRPLIRRLAWGAVAVAGVLPLSLYYTLGLYSLSSGLMWPDTRAYDGLTRALSAAPAGQQAVVVHEFMERNYAWGILYQTTPRPPYTLVTRHDPNPPLAPGNLFIMGKADTARYLLRIAPACRRMGGLLCEYRLPDGWWRAARARLSTRSLALTRDPDGVEYELFDLGRRMTGEELLLAGGGEQNKEQRIKNRE